MKSIMYHYVRTYKKNSPYFRFLDIENFRKQLDFFERHFGFATKADMDNCLSGVNCDISINKIILTFDDAMSCHFDYVLPELLSRGLWGIFYVPSGPYVDKKMLNVHKVHMLAGAFDPNLLLRSADRFLERQMLSEDKVELYQNKIYKMQKNNKELENFKTLINYYLKDEYRSYIIDKIALRLGFKFSESDFYVKEQNLKTMIKSGMVIGSHSHSHPILSSLDYNDQRVELKKSIQFVDQLGDAEFRTYCHPYGGNHSFNDDTIRCLTDFDIDFSFSVENRDFDFEDVTENRHALPRYNCNYFDFGKAS